MLLNTQWGQPPVMGRGFECLPFDTLCSIHVVTHFLSCNPVILWRNLLKQLWPVWKSPVCFQRVFVDAAEAPSWVDSYFDFSAESTADGGRAARAKDSHSFQRLRGSGQSSGLWQTCWQTLDQAVSGRQGSKVHSNSNTPLSTCLNGQTCCQYPFSDAFIFKIEFFQGFYPHLLLELSMKIPSCHRINCEITLPTLSGRP